MLFRALVFWASMLTSSALAEERLLIFAAASLQTALDRTADLWSVEGGGEIAVSYGGTSVLARQIEAGAPADLFFAASPEWMDVVETNGSLRSTTRHTMLSNKLVLIRHGPGAEPVQILPSFDLISLLGDGRLAIALTEAVPAGIYGREALTSLDLWDSVKNNLAQANNTRAALALVASGEAPLGIVYYTDALVEPRVSIVGTFPETSHSPILYPVAITTQSTHPDAEDFMTFLRSDAVQKVFESEGFTWTAEN